MVGQGAYQLGVICVLLFWGAAMLGVPDHAAVAGPSEHYTIVFNAFVLMQVSRGGEARGVQLAACFGGFEGCVCGGGGGAWW